MATTNFIPMAAKCICNYGGVEIEISNNVEMIRYRWFGEKVSRWQQIKYTIKGNPYFTINGKREYLDDYMRI